MNVLSPNLSRCGRADFFPDTPVDTVSDSAAFVFPSRLKRSSPSRSLAFAGSGGQPRTWNGGFLSNNVEASHVAQRSVRRLLFTFSSKLKRSSTRRSLALAGSGGQHNTWRCGFYQNDVGAGHVGFSRSVRPLLACFSHVGLEGRHLGAPRLFGERRSARNKACCFCFSVAFPDRGLAAGHVGFCEVTGCAEPPERSLAFAGSA